MIKNNFVIIGSGASLCDDDIAYVKKMHRKCHVIVINDNYKKAPWADYLYFCDRKWYYWHKSGVKRFTGITATLETEGISDWVFGQGDELGLSFDGEVLNTGKNSGYQAINMACLLGAKRIYLLGFDMKYTNEKKHWFGDHPQVGVDLFVDMIKCFETIGDDLKRFEVKVINCTRSTALTCFPISTIQDELK